MLNPDHRFFLVRTFPDGQCRVMSDLMTEQQATEQAARFNAALPAPAWTVHEVEEPTA